MCSCFLRAVTGAGPAVATDVATAVETAVATDVATTVETAVPTAVPGLFREGAAQSPEPPRTLVESLSECLPTTAATAVATAIVTAVGTAVATVVPGSHRGGALPHRTPALGTFKFAQNLLGKTTTLIDHRRHCSDNIKSNICMIK